MDIKREGVAKKKRIRMAVYLVLTAAGLGLVTWRLMLLKPAAPTVERATVWIDTVKRGPMVIDRRGLGALEPEDIIWIPAAFDGQVEKIVAHSGDDVKAGSVMLVLSNPDMQLAANDFEWQVKQAEATLADLKVQLMSKTFDQQSVVASAQSDLQQAALQKEKEEQLGKMQLESDLSVKLAVAKWEQSANKYKMEKQKLDIQQESVDAQLGSARVQVDKLRAAYTLKKQQVADLTIKAGINGRMQEMTLQVGQRVKPGDVLAKIAQPWKLKAELKIAETQAKDILLGQKAEIDTRNGIVPGHVSRIDASIVNGTRTVDVRLDGPLPAGAVPDLSVDGTVEIMRVSDVVFVGRPVFGQENSQVSLFKLDEDGKGATRITVKLGRSSVNTIEVVDGLKVGDQVILSDMSAQDQNPRIRLN
ncbi:MAG TPA: efflux RND transporter periplasmic adaptor subunit [Bryobacteraceae bacterium]|jgi:HlyD family secretion protein|nr:efflux RND transporter periplasmic adaptor subunit [Bryobacteraceae bacterium]